MVSTSFYWTGIVEAALVLEAAFVVEAVLVVEAAFAVEAELVLEVAFVVEAASISASASDDLHQD